MNKPRIIFLGTPEFAVPSLDILLQNGYEIVGVVTAPDKPAGRGQSVQQSAVKQYALKERLQLLQPSNLKDPVFLEALKKLKADLQIIVAFRMLPEQVWNMPVQGTFNLHASLLPQYRGAAPINWAIINGERETGVTTFFLRHEIDTGKIIFKDNTQIADDDTAGEVHDKLMMKGAALVLKTIQAIEAGHCPQTEQSALFQDGHELKKAPKIHKVDCRINWNNKLDEIHNLIRGLSPYPGAWTELNTVTGILPLKVFRASKEAVRHKLKAGTIITDEKSSLKVAVKNGFIKLNEIQQPGKRRMRTEEFLKGFDTSGDLRIA